MGVDPFVRGPLPGVSSIEPPSNLTNLLPRADAVIVCAPLTPATHGLFDEDAFKRMRRTRDLHQRRARPDRPPRGARAGALQEGWIAMAGLDVFETEPLPAGSPLWNMEQVIVTPHVAGRGYRGDRRLAVMLDNVCRFVCAEALVNVADKRRGY